MNGRINLIEPDNIRVDFDVNEGTIVFVFYHDQHGGEVQIPVSSWPHIAKKVNAAIRSYQRSDGAGSP